MFEITKVGDFNSYNLQKKRDANLSYCAQYACEEQNIMVDMCMTYMVSYTQAKQSSRNHNIKDV